jgi:hypothetical protein
MKTMKTTEIKTINQVTAKQPTKASLMGGLFDLADRHVGHAAIRYLGMAFGKKQFGAFNAKGQLVYTMTQTTITEQCKVWLNLNNFAEKFTDAEQIEGAIW